MLIYSGDTNVNEILQIVFLRLILLLEMLLVQEIVY